MARRAKKKASEEASAGTASAPAYSPGVGWSDLSVTGGHASLFIFEESVARVDWAKEPTAAEVKEAGEFFAEKFGETLDRVIASTRE